MRDAVLEIIQTRGKMHNPVTGSGGMLLGTVQDVGVDSPLGLQAGERIATLVSLTLTPLRITDGLARWDGESASKIGLSFYGVLTGAGTEAELRQGGAQGVFPNLHALLTFLRRP